MLYIVFAIMYLKKKEFKDFGKYTLTMVISGISSLLVFPYSIWHMFFGYRGQGVISNLTNIKLFINNIHDYLNKISRFDFNNLLYVFLVLIALALISIIIKKAIKKEKFEKPNSLIKIILIPSIFYFLIVSIASPWIELRYIMPICTLIFILVIYALYSLLQNLFSEKLSNIIISILLVMMLISPMIFKIEPEVMFSDKKDIVQSLKGDLNIPTIYMFNSNENRFLDDILLFSTVDNSYVAKDIEYKDENIQKIFEGKDISKGIVIFINPGQDYDNILETTRRALDLTGTHWIKRLNACDVYYMYK